MQIIHKLSVVFLVVLFVAGCGSSPQSSDNQGQVTYDQNSWKTMIPDSCLSYFDGCNQCRRSAAGEMAACTRKFCAKYSKPECLD